VLTVRFRAPWWVYLGAVSFLAYFCLLVYCDLLRPEQLGLKLGESAGRLVVTAVAPASPADRAGLLRGDVVVMGNGRPLDSRVDWDAVESNVRIGAPLLLEVVRGGATVSFAIPVHQAPWSQTWSRARMELGLTRIVQLVTLVLGLVVVFRKPKDAGARLGGWLLATCGVFSVVLPARIADVWRSLPAPLGAVLWLPFASTLALAGLLLSFFLSFPSRWIKSRLAWLGIWAPLLVVVAVYLRFRLDVVYSPNGAAFPADAFGWLTGVSVGYLVATAVVAGVKYRRADVDERRRIGVLMLGGGVMCVVGGPIVLTYWRSSQVDLYGSAGLDVAMLLLLVVPLSFSYAILRHRLFDVRFMVRQGVRYALARRLLLSVVPGLVVVLAADVYLNRDQEIGQLFAARATLYLAVGAVAVLAQFQRRHWLDALDRRFFRERYDGQRILRRVVEDVRRSPSFERAAEQAVAQIDLALHPTFVTMLGRSDGGGTYVAIATAPPGAGPARLPGGAKLLALARVLGKPLDVSAGGTHWLSSHLPGPEADLVRDLGLELLVPVGSESDGSDALIALGPRRSEEPYDDDDRELLWTIAESLAAILGHDRQRHSLLPTFRECPQCGACYDQDTPACATEGSQLGVVKMPRVLTGRYRLDRRLGRGGMGVVYAAADLSLGRDVAVKVLREELVADPESAARFEREARLTAGFTHPHVVTVYDFGVALGSRAFLVMEWLKGATLREELERHGALPPERVLTIMRAVCSAVEAAHRRSLIHRDLKPENVFLARGDGAESPKVLDFGIAKVATAAEGTVRHATTMGALVGTPQYMAPEQLRGEPIHRSWDVWALGLLAYEMLAGAHPFAGFTIGLAADSLPAALPTPGGRHAAIDPRWRPFFATALAVDSNRRPPSAEAFLVEFERALAGEPA
jgi:eukaryotic-like serine/threonine-protein kinase